LVFSIPSETPQKKLGDFAKQTENKPKQIEFWFVSVQTGKKLFPGLPNKERFLEIFSVCLKKSVCFYCFLPVRNTGKKLGVSRNIPKNNQNRLSFGLFGSN
jgi:hypothetical protein